MLLRSYVLLPVVLLVSSGALTAQSIAWKVTDLTVSTNPRAISVVTMSTNEFGGDNLNRLIRIDAPAATRVDVTVAPGSGLGGNWMRYAPVTATTDCTKPSVAYNSYPAAFSSVTPVYMCFSGPTGANRLKRGYYGAFVTFTPHPGSALVLPVQLDAFPNGYLQLSSTCQTDAHCSGTTFGDLNDQIFTYNVNNTVVDPAKPVYAVVVAPDNPATDPNGLANVQVGVALAYAALDKDGQPAPWVTVSILDPAKGTTLPSPVSSALLKIGIDPGLLPAGQSSVSGRVRINSGGKFQGEGNVFVNAQVTLPPPALSFGLAGTINDPKGACSAGVTVGLSGGNNPGTTTANDGSYSFSSLLAGAYIITPSKSGCTFTPPSLTVNISGDNLSNNFAGSPVALTLLFPLNGATGISPGSTLTWSAVSGATSYDVYFGVGNPPMVANVAGVSWPIAGASPNVTYAWRIVARSGGATLSSSDTWSFTTGSPVTASGLYFIPVTPCHLVDTRPSQPNNGAFGPPILNGGETRTFYPALGACAGISPSAKAYSFTVTARPTNQLAFLTIWPVGQSRPTVSTLNAFLGGTVSNAAIVPAGDAGGVSVYVTDQAHIQLDINGYFDSVASGTATAFYTLPPCRIADTRNPNATFGGPRLAAGTSRDFPLANSACVPAQANPAAYSLNVTVLPAEALDYVVAWPSNSPQPPLVITLGSPSGAIVADAGLVQGSAAGAVRVYASNQTDVLLDVNGYFRAPGGPGSLLFHPVPPCRIADTRDPTQRPLGGPILPVNTQRTFPVGASSCGIPRGVQAYSLNVTVVPTGVLSFVTLLPTGQSRPLVSTLNDFNGIILANAAIVPAGQNDSIDVYVTHESHVILDINGYFSAQ